jgi:hypothetical protein
MKSKIILGIFILCIYSSANCQNENSKIELNFSSHYSLLGTGDYSAFYYNNGINYSITPLLQISASLGFIYSSNNGENNILMYHHNSYLLGNFYIRILPINTKKFTGYFGFGSSNRYRAEIVLSGLRNYGGNIIYDYTDNFSFDAGYLVYLGFSYKISSKISIILNGEMDNYKDGTGISSVGMGINIKI